MNLNKPVMAIYGGTFDPFHIGHQAICEAVLAVDSVAQLRIIPCHLPALKADARASAFQRLAMLQAWHAQLPEALQSRVVIDDIEIQRTGASYSVDTLTELAQKYPEFQRVFVMGLDSWQSLARWHRSHQLMQMANFWVFSRQGEVNAEVSHGLERCAHWQGLQQAASGYYWLDERVQMNVSSSALRQNIQSNQGLLPKPIAKYIQEHSLYAGPNNTE